MVGEPIEAVRGRGPGVAGRCGRRALPGDRPTWHENGSGLGTYRWVVEQSLALLHRFRRLRTRWEIRHDIHEAFLSLARAIICWRRLRNLSLC